MVADVIIAALALVCIGISVYFLFFRKKKHNGCSGCCGDCRGNCPFSDKSNAVNTEGDVEDKKSSD